jgi:hypothetical protein
MTEGMRRQAQVGGRGHVLGHGSGPGARAPVPHPARRLAALRVPGRRARGGSVQGTWVSATATPKSKANLYVELAERREPDLRALLPEVATGLVEMGPVDVPEAVRFARVRRIDHAYASA